MTKKTKIIIVISLVCLLTSFVVITSSATAVAPYDGVPLGGFNEEIHYPQFNYNYSWWGSSNSGPGDFNSLYCTQYLGGAPVVYGSLQDLYTNNNGYNTFSRYGGTVSYLEKYVTATNSSQNVIRWYNWCKSVIPKSFGITAESTITPPHSDTNSLLKFPTFDFIFDPNGVIGDGNLVVQIKLRFRLYTNEIAEDFVTIEPFVVNIPSTAFNRYVGGDVGYQEQPCFSLNLTDVLLPILTDHGWNLNKGIYWEYIDIDFADVAIPNVNGNSVTNFLFYETVSYNMNDYRQSLLAYNGAVDTYYRQVGYNEGYDVGYVKGQYDGNATGFENGYNVGYNEGQSFLMIVPNFLEGVVEPFFSLEIFPNFSIGALLSVLVGAFVVLWILKLIAGG